MAESKPFVTRNEIKCYRDIIDRYGVAGAIVVYGKLKEKGFAYAGWAGGVASGNTITGQAALDFMQETEKQRHGTKIPQETVDKIRIGMAKGYLDSLESNIDTGNQVNTSQDITYEQAKKFHSDVFKHEGMSIDYWTLNVPMDLIEKHMGGKDAQEAAWQNLLKTEGDYFDALFSGFGFDRIVKDFADGFIYRDDVSGEYVPAWLFDSSLENMIPPKGVSLHSVSSEDFAKAKSWAGKVVTFSSWIEAVFDWLTNSSPSLDEAEQASCPIIIDMNGDGIHSGKLATGSEKAIHFDLDGNGFAEKTAWINTSDAFLVLDKNANGKIDNGKELFGNHTLDEKGNKSFADGYAALVAYDENKDGKIDAQDSIYAQLALWQDKNQNGISEEGEIISLAEAGISSIDLHVQTLKERDANGNIITHRGSVRFADGREHIAEDVWFQINPAQTRYVGDVQLSPERAAELLSLPNVRAFGNVMDLHLAMSQDALLKEKVQAYLQAAPETQENLLKALIYRWTGSENVASGSRGDHIDARTLVALEALTGKAFRQNGSRPNPNHNAAPHLKKAFAEFANYTHAWLMLYSKAHQETALHFWQVMSRQSQNKDGIDWKDFADHLQSLQAQDNSAEAKAAYRMMNGLFTYSSAYQNSLSDYLMEHSDEYGALFAAEVVIPSISGDEQNNTLKGTEKNDILYGKAGNDTLNGGAGNDVLDGGTGNDSLNGGVDNDVYVFSKGHGQDVIYDPHNDADDRIIFTDLKREEVIFRQEGYHLIMQSSETDSVKITNFFHSDAYKIEHFQFADQSFSLEDLMTKGLLIHGTEANDTFQYWGGKAEVYAGAGNDILHGADKDDVLYGEDGDDKLYGNGGNDRLYGGAGNDRLEGGAGNDTYVFSKGHGQDVIYDPHNDADDRIIFTDLKREEVIFRQEGYHLIMQSSETDSVKITNFFHSDAYKIEHFQFADQSFSLEDLMTKGLLIHGTEANDTFQYWGGKAEVYAGAGNDTLHGADKDDVLYGEDGDDKLYGKGGNDRLIGGAGNDYLEGGAGNDTYVFSKGHGQDVIYDYQTTANSDTIQFTDLNRNAVIFRQEGYHLIMQSSETDSVKITNFFHNDAYKIEHFQFADQSFSLEDLMTKGLLIHGTEANDTFQYWRGKAEVYAGAGNDILHGADKDDVLYGEDGDDKLYGKGGNDRLIGGAGNDYLEGGAGNDTYVFSKGHGQDVIYDYQTTANSDTIQFTDLNRNAVIFRQEGYHLIMQSSETDSVKITNFFHSDAYKIEHFQFADQSFSLEDLMTKGLLIHGTQANDTFQYWRGKAEVYAGAGNDILHGADKDDVLYGEDGDDKLYGKGGNDRLIGGAGNDRLEGGAGNDTYVFSKGHGQDVIYDYQTTANSDTIQFTDLNRNAVIFRQEGYHLIMQSSETDSVKITNFFHSDAYKIEHFQFADQSFSLEDLMTKGLLIHGTEANDTFQYWRGKAEVYAGAGNDILHGADKDDVLYGEDGDDKLYGKGGNDRLIGGAGNDRLEGGAGNDTYVFSKGHGQDVIYDPHNDADDRIIFTDLKREEVIFRQEGYHLIMQSSETDSVKITNFFHSDAYKIEHFQFADQSFSLEDLMTKGLLIHGTEANDTFQYWHGKAEVYAGAGNDTLHGADKDDVLYGEDGDDKLYSNGGNDRLYGGDGADYLYAGAGDDVLSGGKGADRLHGSAGADVFVFDVADDAVDIIEDFNVQEDKIALSREIFSALGEQLKAEAFALGTQADTQEQRVLFDVKTGSLLYDADGAGAMAAQHVATLRGSALHALSHEHFEIV